MNTALSRLCFPILHLRLFQLSCRVFPVFSLGLIHASSGLFGLAEAEDRGFFSRYAFAAAHLKV
jgi:hypothetical protein